MDPLRLVDWRAANRAFCVVMWLAAVVLAVLVIGRLAGPVSLGLNWSKAAERATPALASHSGRQASPAGRPPR